MSFLGYALYLGFIFLPGLGVGEVLGTFSKRDTVSERLAVAFGIGLCLDTLVIAVRTSGVGPFASGLDVASVGAVILGGFAVLLVSIALRKTFTFPIRPRPLDWVVFATMACLLGMLAFYLQKYPIFPEYNSYDPQAHLSYVQGLISGQVTSVPAGLLYYGVHFQLAASYLLVGGNILESINTTLVILVVLSVLIFYLISMKLFSSKKVALVTILLYAFSGGIWFGSVFDAGLYANFFGVLISLFTIGLAVELQSKWSASAWILFLLAVPAVYFSHYSSLTIIPPLLLLPLLQLIRREKGVARSLLPVVVVSAPVLIGVVVSSNLVSTLNGAVHSGFGTFTGGTYLSGVLSQIPVLSYMAAEFLYDPGFILMWLFVGLCIWKVILPRLSVTAIPLIWLLVLLVTSPFGGAVWRWSYEALVPFTLMGASGLSLLVPKLKTGKKGKVVSGSYWRAGLVLGLVIGVTVAGSWGPFMLSDASTMTTVSSNAQNSVYDAILWLKTGTPANSSYLSVSDWRFDYTTDLIGRPTTYQYESTPVDALDAISGTAIRYIIVTNLVTLSLQPIPSLFPWNNFPSASNGNLTLIYSNSDVRIYQLAS